MLATLHRWWGVAFCLLFAMWFASGIVMHFVPFPARSERPATHEIDASRANTERIDHDQWTVAGDFDRDRPLNRIALNDDAGTEVYVSSATGAVVLTTTRSVRVANYFGSIAHWIYPTELRHYKRAWHALVWGLSLIATIGAALGRNHRPDAARQRTGLSRPATLASLPGLIFAPFLLSWILSGFLSMDDGKLIGHSDALFRALHKLDFPLLVAHPRLRSSLIVALCLCGLAFSLTGVVLAWQRTTRQDT